MKSVIIYYSVHGNTSKVAKAIYESASKYGKAKLVSATQFKPSDISSADVVLIGTPTQGGRPTPVVQSLLKQFGPATLRGMYIATFDTRFSISAHGT